MNRAFLVALLVVPLMGCGGGPRPLYEWGGYQRDLLNYAKNPGETRTFADRLQVDITKAEARNKVPPGLYAEYGYALVTLGDVPAALAAFDKERTMWPESAPLMNKIMSRLSAQASAAETRKDGAAQ